MNTKCILAVDDMPTVLSILKTLLRGEFQVFTANSVKIAMGILEKGNVKFDLIFLDVDMPHVSGFEMLEMLKSNPNFQNIPVIMLTGSADPDSVIKAISAGAVDYILKPFTADVLKRKLYTVLKP